MREKLVLIVIDGLTPAMLERAVESEDVPRSAFLMSRGEYRRAVTTFPSLTPVCLSSIATGAHPDVHEIPHLVWYHRGEQRLVEYGSSFGAVRAAGRLARFATSIFNLNEEHLSKKAVTVFEALEAAGLVTAAVNMVCYRGPRGTPARPVADAPRLRAEPLLLLQPVRVGRDRCAARGPHPRARVGGRVREGRRPLARHAGRLRLPRLLPPGLRLRLARAGPEAAHDALVHADRAIATLLEAAGGPDEFLERYAVLLCSDHGQTRVDRSVKLEDAFRDFALVHRGNGRAAELAVTASNRAGMSTGCPPAARRRGRSPSGSTAGVMSSSSGKTSPWWRGRTVTS
jgi:hypothetical protein